MPNKGELILRGDANRRDDSSPVPLNAVRGLASLRVPFIGKPLVWARYRDYSALLATAAVLAALIRLATWWRAPWTAEEAPKRHRRRRVPRLIHRAVVALRSSRAALTKVGCITAVLIVVGFGLGSGTPAQAKLSATAATRLIDGQPPRASVMPTARSRMAHRAPVPLSLGRLTTRPASTRHETSLAITTPAATTPAVSSADRRACKNESAALYFAERQRG